MKEFKIPSVEDEKTTLKTIRIKLTTLKKIEKLAKDNNISVNRLINASIEFALDNITKEDLGK